MPARLTITPPVMLPVPQRAAGIDGVVVRAGAAAGGGVGQQRAESDRGTAGVCVVVGEHERPVAALGKFAGSAIKGVRAPGTRVQAGRGGLDNGSGRPGEDR